MIGKILDKLNKISIGQNQINKIGDEREILLKILLKCSIL